MNEWINVNERLPKNKKLLLVAMPWINPPNYNFHLGYFHPNSGWDLPYFDGVINVRYWMEIPEISNSI